MPRPDPLARYNAKRDFTKTAEPAGTVGKSSGNVFMVQKHDATRLHWDLRLEVDGVLKSWAVTRGPSLNPDDKRLAVRTEDHPLSYATFEGTIPAKEYGGGTVMLWDRGTWAPIPGKSAKDIDDGHLHFVIDGERMKGEWMLIRLKPRGRERGENWLLRKVDDAFSGGSDDLVEREVTSIATGRTMEEIAANAPPKRAARRRQKATLPKFQSPQLATLVDNVPSGSGWLHEVKYDGYRALLAVANGQAKVFTRSGLDWSDKFPGIVKAAAALNVDAALIDGEIVVLDEDGRPSFSALQAALKAGGGNDLTMFAFDMLAIDGENIGKLANVERKARLRAVIDDRGTIKFAEHIIGGGEQLFAAMCHEGYEGVVSKRADAPYSGRRTHAWLKTKCTRRQEFVIVGWTESGARHGFKSLLLGLNEDGALRYAGKVGTGFDAELLSSLRETLGTIEIEKAPVAAPKIATRGARWVKPTLVAEIAFAEFTADNVVRHASFIGLRSDKQAKAVRVERAERIVQPTHVKITNPDRVIFPGDGITKAELAEYYQHVGSIMLPFIADRPISLVRCPQGRAKQCFFQKHDAGSFGPDVHAVPIREKDGSTEEYLWVDTAEGLVACVQMGSIEFHGWGSRASNVEQPDRLVFDLDPDEALGFDAVKKAAVDLKGHLADLGLISFVMLTGGKGVHIVVPLTPDGDWAKVKDFADRFAQAIAQAEPDRFVATMSKAKRKGRIFIDWLRNQRGATAVLPYVVRARPGAPVAAPITWDELRAIDGASHFHLTDAEALIERATSKNLRGWGVADQVLPDI